MIKINKTLTFIIATCLSIISIVIIRLLRIDELKNVFTLISLLAIVAITLLVHFFLVINWNVRTGNKVLAVSLILFFVFGGCFYWFIREFEARTISYTDKETSEKNYYVKGTKLDTIAQFYKNNFLKKFGNGISDNELLLKFEGKPEKVWLGSTIQKNRRYLIVAFSIVIMFFTAFICVLSEAILAYNRKVPEPFYSVFISYNTIDSFFARRLNRALKEKMIITFFWDEDAPGTRNNIEIMNSEIDKKDKFLFIASGNSLKSEPCQHELRIARYKYTTKSYNNYSPVYIDDTLLTITEEEIIVQTGKDRNEVWKDIEILRQFNPVNFKAFSGADFDAVQFDIKVAKFINDSLKRELKA
jgi:hypothetical protein